VLTKLRFCIADTGTLAHNLVTLWHVAPAALAPLNLEANEKALC